VVERLRNLHRLRIGLRSCLLCAVLLHPACAPQSEPSVPAEIEIDQILGVEADAAFARASQARTFEFPRDHGAHPEYRSEWWYFTMVLKDGQGEEFGVQFTLFRQALAPAPFGAGPWANAQVYLGHLAVTDVARGEHRHAQRFSRGHPQLAGVQTVPGFLALIEDWTLSAADGDAAVKDRWVLEAADLATGIALVLNIDIVEPFVLQGEGGLSRKGPASASYYYSQPRMHTVGEIRIDEKAHAVSGFSWMDREWSTSVLEDYLVGWDWFALQLDDGRSLMVFQLRRRDGTRDPYDHGMLVDGTEHTLLTADDFELQPTQWWRDQQGTRWPIGWRVQIGDTEYRVRALVPDQLMDTSIVYWEGLVAVTDDTGRDVGRGYLELTGYRTAGGRGGRTIRQ
jgi:predicted secreted hydrolase